MKRFLKALEGIFVIYFASMGLSLLASTLLNIPLKFIIKDYNNLTNFLVGIIGLIIAMFALSFIYGYKANKLEIKPFLCAAVTFLILLIIVISFIGRAVYISGPTDYLASYIVDNLSSTFATEKQLLNQRCLIYMVCAYIVLYMPTIIIAKLVGVNIKKQQLKNLSALKIIN